MEAKEVPLPEQQESEDHFNLPPITVAYIKNIPVTEPQRGLSIETLERLELASLLFYVVALYFYLGVAFALYLAKRREES